MTAEGQHLDQSARGLKICEILIVDDHQATCCALLSKACVGMDNGHRREALQQVSTILHPLWLTCCLIRTRRVCQLLGSASEFVEVEEGASNWICEKV